MQFLDLNIAYLEGGEKSANKQNRLRLIIKAMELGYTGVAYNKTINGSMSESDRCSIPPFPLSSLLKAAPSLSSTVSFHRRLLGVSDKIPFHQYTRLTVIVENAAQASALNSGNPILKTYDLVSVRPQNQNCFDQACQSSQVDLISINFAHKLPFRLKPPMVKAAIDRGVYFEIMYSSLMEDVQARRQLISNAKLLVEWTRGKNLIVSSAAQSVVELRGPNDVSNLASLFGLSNEHAKAAISKNCRLLVANALKKKQFYKEAIRVELMPAGAQTDPKEPWIVDDFDWDPISSGEGDLCLDDMAKSFVNYGKVSHTVKAVDFASIIDSGQSHGLQVKELSPTAEGKPSQCDNIIDFISKDVELSKDTVKLQKEPTPFLRSQLDQHVHGGEKSLLAMSVDSPKASPVYEGLRGPSTVFLQKLGKPDGLEGYSPGHELQLQKHIASHPEDMLISSAIEPPTGDGLDVGNSADSKEEVSINMESVPSFYVDAGCRLLLSDAVNDTEVEVSAATLLGGQSDVSVSLTENPELDTTSTIHANEMMNMDPFVKRHGSGVLLPEEVTKERGQREKLYKGEFDNDDYLLADTMMEVDSSPRGKDNVDILTGKSELPEDVTVEARNQEEENCGRKDYDSLVENRSDNQKVKRWLPDQVCRFPFKRLLQVQFKKKGRKCMHKSKR